jgi:septal ring factor EnvC (AmiA/AmiB activator)
MHMSTGCFATQHVAKPCAAQQQKKQSTPVHVDCLCVLLVLAQVSAARNSLEAQLSSSRAEVTALTSQLAELRGSLAAARDSAVAAEITATRLQEERVRLSKVCAAAMHPSSTHSLMAQHMA